MRCALPVAATTVALLSLGMAPAAIASPVTWLYQGQLGTSGRPDALPVGSLVYVTLAFDSSAPDLLPGDPGCGVYQGAATTTVAGLVYTGPVWFEIDVASGCGRPSGAMYVIGVGPSGPIIPYPPPLEPIPPFFTGIPASRLYLETTGFAGSSDALPLVAPTSMFFELYFDHQPCGNYCGGDPYGFRVVGGVQAVPEPLGAALLGVGLAAFLVRRRAPRRRA